jgi:endonuclease YncB( thermonuclease family)
MFAVATTACLLTVGFTLATPGTAQDVNTNTVSDGDTFKVRPVYMAGAYVLACVNDYCSEATALKELRVLGPTIHAPRMGRCPSGCPSLATPVQRGSRIRPITTRETGSAGCGTVVARLWHGCGWGVVVAVHTGLAG